MSIDWFSVKHGTPSDAKLTMIAKKIGVRRCEMTAVWFELMDYASQYVTRGHVTDCDLELIAFTQEIPLENVQKIHAALNEKSVIKDDQLSTWDKHQPKGVDPTAAKRKREQREREKAEKLRLEQEKNNCSHVTSRDSHIDQTRPEENRIEKNPLTPKPENLESSEEGFLNNSGDGSGLVGWDVLSYLRQDENGYEKAINYANSANLDLRGVIENYNQIRRKNGDYPNNPVGAFLSWMKKIPQGKPPT